jgi:hypothetical protein
MFGGFIFNYNKNSSDLFVLLTHYNFPVDISRCSMLSAIVSQIFPCLDNLEMCGLHDIVSALETDDTRWATHSFITVKILSCGILVVY